MSCSTSSTCSDRAPLIALIALAALGACQHLPAPAHARPALPLPVEIAARYALAGPVIETSLVPIGGEDGMRFFRGRLRSGGEEAEFHYLAPPGDGPHPFVLCLPILAGGRALMWMVSLGMARHGFAVGWTDRVASALKPGQRAHEIELLLRRTVVHNRMLLEWARAQPAVDQGRMGCVGVSMGGMIGGIMMALEPELRAGALCLAGGDLADLLVVSDEGRARSWRRWRHVTDGASGEELALELRRGVVTDPALLGPYVPAEKVLLIGGTFDAVVPMRHQDLLWESLGRPERRLLPLGHYTAALGFGSILGSVQDFIAQRLRRDAAVPGDG